MKLYHKWIYVLFSIFVAALLIYSYSLIDLNLTLFNDELWLLARDSLVRLGYFQRELSSYIYIAVVLVLFYFHWLFTKNYKVVSFWKVVIPLLFLGVSSYPLLSHDFFNYMFDAKILTFYHQNPYVMRPLDFPSDPWLRFMHWVHRTYPYGPVFLPITLIPSFLSFGKFVLAFYLFKATSTFFYLAGSLSLFKMNKKWAIFFATNPLVVIEGLVNGHNDMIAAGLALIGIYFLFQKKNLFSRTFFLLSGGIKYLTIPFLILSREKKHILNKIAFSLLVCLLLYLSITQEVQPWYFLGILPFIVFFEGLISKLSLFFAGLLLSYFPYIRFGEWDTPWKINLKHQIIIGFLVANAVYLLPKLKTKFFKR
ncbi:hypothetical protein A3G67_01980 [Candidatus Roizmanbacteria bacterium RIFCSPLOWO2_12_FULL_40_12]|uniref:DUF2029 domain-containing protein n=1 Tax=Candidatus Roizmanbacteria bacterium RIFCSPLOWO2_01_FULL_40_42 TaxID=1802066 RepID=A0A1F7J3J7_9BACT|nr:MAG: hypothetical protein A2779_01100 [Candidatus Roizmanbacteria bacterium RIFCSPHIGHO2_01_FULL_40_98]OGK28964.1 MAG: hypothetical protein A3C31_01740 [Candidatus Roizmanbacteria bacterium RIFCSPHIGHO2_02_FULL_40_53]OGK29570.1 MAG: hypothetical protein A2W49_03800 [Candidatus Roizmanbacteria bacterium RIFCSPHIGHO2_12_41_18]OGK37251.1 MAG: hypothetical protein A3E69_04040 [Candidatus Roizmanbacteria bacterium RIFCSPHIGHO2_12_FULL_40_130]OGK50193.1 MAG: hypothetical protein A3B50_00195 [Candi